VTFNVWFDNVLQSQRTASLLRLLRETNADVICLQEATTFLERVLHADKFVCEHWAMTSFAEQTRITQSWYGTLTLVSKRLLKNGWSAEAKMGMFERSEFNRCFLALDLVANDGTQVRLVFNSVCAAWLNIR
jgi:exonuclease III